MMSKAHAWLPVVFVVLLLGVSAAPAAPAQQVPPATQLSDYAYPLSNYLERFGPEVPFGWRWHTRKFIGNFMDLICYPESLETHPLLDPVLGPFISVFHQARVWEGLDDLSHRPAPLNGLQVTKFYSSGWVVKADLPDGGTFKFAVDFSEGPFNENPLVPGMVGLDLNQFQTLANELDAYFITHSHIDHFSPYLSDLMLQMGKLVVMPMDMKVAALLYGYPFAQDIVVPPNESPVTFGPLDYAAFAGHQWGAFLDPGETVGDPNHPLTVENNCYLFRLNGVEIAHFGDNNDRGVVPFAQTKTTEGWTVDAVMNLGRRRDDLMPILQPEIKLHTHELEFHHVGSAFLPLHVPVSGPNPLRRTLFWGESLDVVPQSGP